MTDYEKSRERFISRFGEQQALSIEADHQRLISEAKDQNEIFRINFDIQRIFDVTF